MSKELLEKYAQRESEILKKVETICKDVVDNKREFTPAEHADIKKYKEEQRSIRQVREDLEEMFKNAEATRSVTRPVDAPTPAEQFEAETRASQATSNPADQERLFANLGEQLRAIKRASAPGAVADPRLEQVRQRDMARRAASGLSENVDADGAFLLEPAIADELLKQAREGSVLYNLVSRRRLTVGNSLKMKGLSDDSRVKGSLAGGIAIYPAAEADDYTASKIKWRDVSFELKKIIAACYVTDEEIEDIPLLTDRILEEFTEAFGVEIDGYLFEGDGVTVSQGLIKSPARVTQEIEDGQDLTNPIVPQNVVKMRSRGLVGSRPKAIWLIQPDLEPYLHLMALEVGVGGGPVFMPMGGLSADPYDKLMGRPIIPFEHCNAIGTPGDLVYTDPSKMVLIDKNGLKAQVSIHVRFLQDEQCFKFTYRFDAKIPYDKPLTPRKGTIKKSPVVLLDTRTA